MLVPLEMDAQNQVTNDERVMTLVEQALERPSSERREFVEAACAGDSALLDLAWKYVQQEERLGDFLSEPLFAPPPEIQEVLHYEVSGVIGQGGQAKVYKAWDKNLKRHVALKFLPAYLRGRTQRERFLREAAAVSSLDHPNLASVHAIEETSAGLFIVMPFYEGESLRQRLDRGPVTVAEALNLARQIAQGLAAAHAAGVVHRDLKPSNIILTKQGLAKIIDFGVAQVDGSTRLTDTGTRIGTVAYMSPEQAMGEPTDARTDLWSLGVVLFELLNGKAPFQGENARKVIHGILTDEPAAPAGASSATAGVVRKLLSKPAAERYQTANELLDALTALQTQPEPVTETLVWPVPTRLNRRWAASAVAVLALLATLGLAWQKWGGSLQPSVHRVAVLTFETQSSDPAEQAFANGLAGALSDSLAGYERTNSDLLVIRPAELQAQRVTDIESARKAFGVSKALAAVVTRETGQVRIALTLVDAVRRQPEASATVTGTEAAVYPRVVEQTARMLHLKAAPEAKPVSGSVAWLRGMGYLERYDKPGNIDRAVAEFDGALRNGTDTLALVGLSEAYRMRYDVTKDPQWLAPGVDYASRAIAEQQDLPQAWAARGAARNSQNDYKGAVDDFQRALLLDGRADRAYRGLGLAFEGMGLKDRAEEIYREAVQIQPNSSANHNRLGSFYYRMARYKEAQAEFRSVVQLAPDAAPGYSNLAGALLAIGDLPAAQQALQKSIAISPSWGAYTNLGNVFRRRKSYVEAAKAYESALELNSSSYKTWANLAGAYLHTEGQHDKGLDAFRKAAELAEAALKQSPRDGLLLSDLAAYYVQFGKRTEPLELLGQALAIAPRDVKVLANAAEAYELLGFRKQALESLATAVTLGFSLRDVEDVTAFQNLQHDSRFKAMVPALK